MDKLSSSFPSHDLTDKETEGYIRNMSGMPETPIMDEDEPEMNFTVDGDGQENEEIPGNDPENEDDNLSNT